MKKVVLLIAVLFISLAGCNRNQEAEKIDRLIDNFLAEKVGNYLSPFLSADHMLFSALALYQENGFDFSFENHISVSAYKDALRALTVDDFAGWNIYNNAFRFFTIARALGADTAFFTDFMLASDFDNLPENSVPLLFMATKDQDLLEIIYSYQPTDTDTAAFHLMALSYDKENVLYQTKVDELMTFMMENLGYGGIESWGTINSCSTAMFVLALMANGINPSSIEYQGRSLIDFLLDYYVGDGFSFEIGGEVDLMFSTPQVFTALIVYRIFHKSGAVSLF
ncbi:MAG: hypothetical protein FWE36_05985 [Erysipelotrichales bacterium]|nr:hypothetical protein [Erysipelotrichales bacterium]